ncbi:MAG: hypothetical protein H8D58_01910, partial [Candidatus Marinimicrobia bacterium]|nr:hypothetical protein [Candidatus Neomarinimicrobiota bacterium]
MKENKRSLNTTLFILSLSFILILMRGLGSGSSIEITENEIMDHIRYLSHEDRGGRYPGTRESKDVISYLVRELKSYGVKPGAGNGAYVQPFNITNDIELGENNSLILNEDSLQIQSDYIPLWFSGNGTVNAPVVFAGYGFEIDDEKLKWHDYSNLDVKGKWV